MNGQLLSAGSALGEAGKANYAINPTPELDLRSNQAMLPARVIAALDVMTLLALLMLGIVGSAEGSGAPISCSESTENRVPLIQLISTPEKWDGKEVRVVGFARFEYEGDALYLTKEDYLLGLGESAIAIYIPYTEYGNPIDDSIDTELNDRQIVEVQGVFHARKDGATRTIGAYTGEIGPVCRLKRWDFRAK